MPTARIGLLCFLLLFTPSAWPQKTQQTSATQPTVQRDPQAIAALQQAVAAMGGNVPADSVATGTVTLVAGSETDQGGIRLLTRGTSQTSVQVQTPLNSWGVTYSQGQGSRTDGATSTALSLEAASTSQCAYFPLPYLAGVLQNPDTALQYIGGETLAGTAVQHVRVWNTFQSSPYLQFLAGFTVTDIWEDSTSGLPRRISFVHRDGGGAAPKIPVTIDFSSYQNIGGVLYPSQILHSVNGTLWITVSVQAASFNTGLTDADFPVVVAGGN
jgi:hypothetical protein